MCLVLAALSAAIGCSPSTAVIGTYKQPTAGGGAGAGVLDAGMPAAVGGSGGQADGGAGMMAAGDGGDHSDEETLRIATGSREQFCAGLGPALRTYVTTSGGGSEPVCTASIARRLFSYALCSCGDAKFTDIAASIDMFDSRRGAYPQSAEGYAPIGVNGSLFDEAGAAVAGTAIVAGSDFLLSGPVTFYGDVKSNAVIDMSGISINFQRDLWVNGDIHGIPTAIVKRDVYQTAGFSGVDSVMLTGSLYERAVDVAPPCPCSDALLDIAAIVASARVDNDNAELGVTTATLSAMLGAGSPPAGFTCGRFALDSVEVTADFSSDMTGRVALFVDGDLTVNSDFGASLAPSAELDVFVAGDLRLAGPSKIGTVAQPSSMRLYVAGAAPLRIDDTHALAAQLYAPRASITATSATPTGAIVAATFESRGAYSMHYDRAITEMGEECSGADAKPAKLSSADACHPCPGGLADLGGGVCGPCQRDADCCEPTACVSGACQPLVLR
jgi:hypothetical protein